MHARQLGDLWMMNLDTDEYFRTGTNITYHEDQQIDLGDAITAILDSKYAVRSMGLVDDQRD